MRWANIPPYIYDCGAEGRGEVVGGGLAREACRCFCVLPCGSSGGVAKAGRAALPAGTCRPMDGHLWSRAVVPAPRLRCLRQWGHIGSGPHPVGDGNSCCRTRTALVIRGVQLLRPRGRMGEASTSTSLCCTDVSASLMLIFVDPPPLWAPDARPPQPPAPLPRWDAGAACRPKRRWLSRGGTARMSAVQTGGRGVLGRHGAGKWQVCAATLDLLRVEMKAIGPRKPAKKVSLASGLASVCRTSSISGLFCACWAFCCLSALAIGCSWVWDGTSADRRVSWCCGKRSVSRCRSPEAQMHRTGFRLPSVIGPLGGLFVPWTRAIPQCCHVWNGQRFCVARISESTRGGGWWPYQ